MLIRMRMLIPLVALTLTGPLAAQETVTIRQVRVEGEVIDRNSGLPIAGVFVQFPQLGRAALSDSLGYFLLDGVPVGEQMLSTHRIGYQALSAVAPIVDGEILALYLTPGVVALPGIDVKVAPGGDDGRSGDYIGPEEIAEMADRTDRMLEVFRTKAPPRLRIEQSGGNGSIVFCVQSSRRRPSVQEVLDLGTGCHPAMIVLDGTPIYTPPSNREFADILSPSLPADVAALILEQRPTEVRSIRVLTPTDAFFRYGDAGRLGAVEITTTRGGRGREGRGTL